MSIFSPHPEERRLRRVSKDQARVVASWFETAQLPPYHKESGYAPIAIFGSASAFAFISFSARRYSTGITLRNFGSQAFQSARISAALFEPVSLAWRVISTSSRSTSDESRFWNTST